jgi:hypothetical protein
MKQPAPSAFSVNLNQETYDLLQKVRGSLAKSLGFVPTHGQVVRHLISIYFKGENDGIQHG